MKTNTDKIMKQVSLFLLTVLLAACAQPEERQAEERTTRELNYTASVSFLKANGDMVSSVEVAVADDENSRSEGLMDVHELPANAGMLFIFEGDQPRSFWMANTPLSLDLIFANSDYEIVRVRRNTPPYSHESITSEAPAKYVVEVNAGYTLRNDITEGMFIEIMTPD